MSGIISRADAKAAGLKRYFTGVACPKGHAAERMVSNWQCCECNRERRSKNNKKNPGRQIAYNTARYEAEKDSLLARQAAYYEANRDKERERKAVYREANRDKVNARQAAYREANRDKVNAYEAAYRAARKAAANQ